MSYIRVKDISQVDERTLGVLWTDGRKNKIDVVDLRRRCPCAVCIDEWTRAQRLKPEDIAESVRPVKIESVGSYALKVQFSDGHSTGIYTFQMLREAFH
ncbi:MAG: DUF971 domain-containing protein [Proteobacteria bacterium]|nr:DUF971 domain-containing protein [Pseudomonadota bacterium]